ncbi:MAG: hypothetical protein LBC10_02025 [Deltaproteobacteria bacterium]|jgi:hypothetical protein|nr:hypothetical protein [Deltaproteobacteria bacterium]
MMHGIPASARPVILDFDASVLPVATDEVRIPLDAWQERIRFACAPRDYARLEAHLESLMPPVPGCTFTGSGDYHHLSLFLLQHLAQRIQPASASLDLVVCDNHPDNMRYPFGLHCGSWVRHAAHFAWVRHIHVIGITSPDIRLPHAWENHLLPFVRKKLWYWSIGHGAAWLGLLGRSGHNKNFASADALITAFMPILRESPALYLSIDKDVFDPSVVRTNWDQGRFAPIHVEAVLQGCAGKLAGCDVTGDVSVYAYAGWRKRLLSRLDGQTKPDAIEGADSLASWQAIQQAMNIRLLELCRAAA